VVGLANFLVCGPPVNSQNLVIVFAHGLFSPALHQKIVFTEPRTLRRTEGKRKRRGGKRRREKGFVLNFFIVAITEDY
jgi:hypothetical protein